MNTPDPPRAPNSALQRATQDETPLSGAVLPIEIVEQILECVSLSPRLPRLTRFSSFAVPECPATEQIKTRWPGDCNCAASRAFLARVARLDSHWFAAASRRIWRHLGVSELYEDFWGYPGKAKSLLLALETSPRREIYGNAVRCLSIVSTEKEHRKALAALLKRLAPIVSNFQNLQSLELDYSAEGIDWGLTDHFLDASRGLPLTAVRLQRINLDAETLSRCLKSWSNLRSIEIDTEAAEGDIAESIAESIPDRTVQHLALEEKAVRFSTHHLETLLPKLVGLKTLRLGDMPLERDEVRTLFANATAELKALEVKRQIEGHLPGVLDGFAGTDLEKLCLSGFLLNWADGGTLVGMLKRNQNLKHLEVRNTVPMHLPIWEAVLAASPPSLRSLVLDGTEIGYLLEDLLPFVTTLEKLVIRNDELHSSALEAVSWLEHLECLELSDVYMENDADVAPLFRENWQKLRTLHVKGPGSDAQWASKVRKWRPGLDIVVD